MRRTSTLRHQWDEQMFSHIRARSRIYSPDRATVLGQYIREARRCGWTWALAADAARVSISTARRYADPNRPLPVWEA